MLLPGNVNEYKEKETDDDDYKELNIRKYIFYIVVTYYKLRCSRLLRTGCSSEYIKIIPQQEKSCKLIRLLENRLMCTYLPDIVVLSMCSRWYNNPAVRLLLLLFLFWYVTKSVEIFTRRGKREFFHIMAYMIEIVAVPVFSSSHADQK